MKYSFQRWLAAWAPRATGCRCCRSERSRIADAAITTARPSTTLRKAMSTEGSRILAALPERVKRVSREDAKTRKFSPRPPRLRVKRLLSKRLYCRQSQFERESIRARSRRASNNQSINVFSEDPLRKLTLVLMLLLLVSLPVMAQQATDTAAAETDTTATTTAATAATETAAAPKTEPAAAGAAQGGKVGVSLTNLGKLDLATGTYNVEFYLTFTCPEGVTDCSTDFTLDSGVVTKSEIAEKAPGRTVFRIKADMTEDLDLSEYPLDEHELTISFTHPTEDATKLVYAIDKDNTSVGASVKLAGFNIVDSGANVETKKFDGVDENFSVYTFHITAQLVRLSSYLERFLPTLFVVL